MVAGKSVDQRAGVGAGVARRLPRFIWAPVLRQRNRETLRRLRFLSEGRRRERDAGDETARPAVLHPPQGQPGADAAAGPIAEAARGAAEGTEPSDDLNAKADYRAHLAQVLTRRAVTAAAGLRE